MKPKPFPQIEGKRIARAEIEEEFTREYALTLTFTDGCILRVVSDMRMWGDESWLDIELTYGPG